MKLPDFKINFYNLFKFLKSMKKDIIVPTGRKYLLSFAINNYPNSSNNLKGCLNDQKNISDLFYDYTQYLCSDAEVTKHNIQKKIETVLSFAQPGDAVVLHFSGHGTQIKDVNGDETDGLDEALYVYDGVLSDDTIGEILSYTKKGVYGLFICDSCHSESITRDLNNIPPSTKPHNICTKKGVNNWTVISGCKAAGTSADAMFCGVWEGALSHYICATAKEGQSVEKWFKKLKKTGVLHYQTPTFEEGQKNVSFINQLNF